MSNIELDVRNMSCGSCVNNVTQALNQVAGVTGVEVDLRSGRVRVQASDAMASTAALTTALVAALDAAGYPAAPAASLAAAAPGKSAAARAGSSGCGSAQPQGHGHAGSKGCCCGH